MNPVLRQVKNLRGYENGSKNSEQVQLGQLLVQRGLLTEAALALALEEQARTGQTLGRLLIDASLVKETDLVATLASQLGLSFVDLSDYPVDKSAVALIPDGLSRRYLALPIGWDGNRLIVAMADPSNVFAIDDIRHLTGREVQAVVATRASIQTAIDKYQRLNGDAENISAQASSTVEAEEDLSAIREVVEDAPIVKLVNVVITQAVADRASDIHIEPTEHDVRIRYRIDGVLHEEMRAPKNIQAGIISRLKIMADINIAERRIPQDGRVTATVAGRAVDLRVATLPTVHGEKVVMRILDKSNALLQLTDLGFLPENMRRYEQSYRKPYGTILVTGPTGSGKSTTLYATLNIVNDESKNVITVEDPVEYRLPNINQVQVNVKAGLTFAAALRSILRSDPDIVLVGEIRDRETANIAVQAALTGHLVLTTLHTNDAASTPMRLIEMGVEPFLVGSALDCIVAQRLARKLCDKCKERFQPTRAELATVGWDIEAEGGEIPIIYRPVGCTKCSRTGYYGRFAIHEVMPVTEDIERCIVERGQSEDLKKLAVAEGMLTLRQSGLRTVRSGNTSIEEILRVIA
ncbi:MAG: type pilus assembly protein PilB [Acidimicrobiaceae bacterium]|jgi:type IV pilus assembly protein PilB|nr:type pilus assembly protein PilB [Acidimicrobiaceae bacterium]MDQ1398229.1 type pilus assembly protein PilB [Acidimicrobiaceae bacterium]MDQ1419803.1 type pilus assembly protein PilB [Acidimicrobiaceae bacterium]MDQ1440836.1 type pilus assembly protein PilB [Acidimicrobiaceae bacterium]